MKYIPSEKSLALREQTKADVNKLIAHLSAQRKLQLGILGNTEKFLELERKYGKYLMVPLALPVFELPDTDHFLSWWKQYAIRPVKQHGDYVVPDTGYSPFETIDLVQKIGNDWNLNFQTDNFKKEFPKLWQQFHDQLPCDDLLVINLWSSVQTFPEHRDSAEMIDSPNSFRIKLYDENPEETLFVADNPLRPYHNEEATFLPRLEGTNSYMWNNLRLQHGSIFVPPHRKILAVITGLVNPDRYDELLAKSIATYGQYCLVSNYSLENYIDL